MRFVKMGIVLESMTLYLNVFGYIVNKKDIATDKIQLPVQRSQCN